MQGLAKRLTALCLLSYFAFGSMLLPQGDFSVSVDLPAMYRQCKATEDPDMTPFDFIKDHLLNIDGAFDAHDHGDEQKPHQPVAYHHLLPQVLYTHCIFNINGQELYHTETCLQLPIAKNDHSGFLPSVFHPPLG
ncbi:MAG: hypothetical protein R2794_00325 [Chitinophagales bacterium]